jgi:transcription termination factor NusB
MEALAVIMSQQLQALETIQYLLLTSQLEGKSDEEKELYLNSLNDYIKNQKENLDEMLRNITSKK